MPMCFRTGRRIFKEISFLREAYSFLCQLWRQNDIFYATGIMNTSQLKKKIPGSPASMQSKHFRRVHITVSLLCVATYTFQFAFKPTNKSLVTCGPVYFLTRQSSFLVRTQSTRNGSKSAQTTKLPLQTVFSFQKLFSKTTKLNKSRVKPVAPESPAWKIVSTVKSSFM